MLIFNFYSRCFIVFVTVSFPPTHLSLPLSGLLIAMVVSMLFLLLLRFTAPVMVWVLIIGVLGAGAYGKHSPFSWQLALLYLRFSSSNIDSTSLIQWYKEGEFVFGHE